MRSALLFAGLIVLFSLSGLILPAGASPSASSTQYHYQILSGTHTVSGQQNALVVLVDFKDVHHTRTAAEMEAVALSQLNAYYSEVSHNHVSVFGKVFGWYTLGNTMGYYGHDGRDPGDDDNKWQLAADALSQLPAGTDVSSFRYLVIVHAGKDQANDQADTTSDEIWSSCYCAVFPLYEAYRPVYFHGKSFSNFAFLSEYDGVGTFAHEWGHLLGLPDLYDTKTGDSFVGYWSLMDVGNYCCYNRAQSSPSYIGGWGSVLLGWLSPVIGDPTSSISAVKLAPLESAQATAMVIPVTRTTYYFVEERVAIGMDRSLPESGMVVYFVDESLDTGRGIVRLINPTTDSVFAEQDKATALNHATFNAAGHFVDEKHQVYLNFIGTNPITAIYTTRPFTGSLLDTQIHPAQTMLAGEYNSKTSFVILLLDQNGVRLSGQSVNLEEFGPSGQWLSIGSVTTDLNGGSSFEITLNFTVGTHDLRLSYSGGEIGGKWYLPSSFHVSVSVSPGKMFVTLSPAPLAITSISQTVAVTDSHGNPIPNVIVTPYLNSKPLPPTRTDQAGRASFTIPLSLLTIGSITIDVRASKTNYDPASAAASILAFSFVYLVILLGAVAGLILFAVRRISRNKKARKS